MVVWCSDGTLCVFVCVCVCVHGCTHVLQIVLTCLSEYVGNVPPELRDSLLSDLNKETTRLIQVDGRGGSRRGEKGAEGGQEGAGGTVGSREAG